MRGTQTFSLSHKPGRTLPRFPTEALSTAARPLHPAVWRAIPYRELPHVCEINLVFFPLIYCHLIRRPLINQTWVSRRKTFFPSGVKHCKVASMHFSFP